jgi:hypothetical protein
LFQLKLQFMSLVRREHESVFNCQLEKTMSKITRKGFHA